MSCQTHIITDGEALHHRHTWYLTHCESVPISLFCVLPELSGYSVIAYTGAWTTSPIHPCHCGVWAENSSLDRGALPVRNRFKTRCDTSWPRCSAGVRSWVLTGWLRCFWMPYSEDSATCGPPSGFGNICVQLTIKYLQAMACKAMLHRVYPTFKGYACATFPWFLLDKVSRYSMNKIFNCLAFRSLSRVSGWQGE